MKKRLLLIFIITAVLLSVSVSFNIVQAVTGGSPAPGSDQDPLVSKSYVDSSVSQANAAIQQANAAIQQANTAIQQLNATLEQSNTALQSLQTEYDALKKAFDDMNAKVVLQDQTIKTLQDTVKGIKTAQPSGNGGTPAQTTGNGGTPTQTTGSAAGKAVINVASLNIRSQANTTSTVVGKALKGETVTILSKSGDWYKVKNSKGITGFVLGKYITVSK